MYWVLETEIPNRIQQKIQSSGLPKASMASGLETDEIGY